MSRSTANLLLLFHPSVQPRLINSYVARLDLLHVPLLTAAADGYGLHLGDLDAVHLLIHGVEVHVRDLGVLAVEDLGHFLERDAAGLDEEEDHEEDFEEEPALEARKEKLESSQLQIQSHTDPVWAGRSE
jgi:hypothetical protein